EVALKVDETIRSNKEVRITGLTVGGRNGEPNVTDIYVALVPMKEREISTADLKARLREQLKVFTDANPLVKDFDAVGGGMRPFTLNIIGNDMDVIVPYGQKIYAYLKNKGGLLDPDTNYREGKPEFQVIPNKSRMEMLGISSFGLGQELRAQIEGVTPAKFRETG